MDRIERMKELVELLNKASESYYAKDAEIMSNFEYDRLYDELTALEEETGMTLAGSPTLRVGYEAVDELPKARHEQPMLSLGKTKEREELRDWLGDKKGILSWKLDGLTVVITYEKGELVKAVTRGNGEVGEVVTGNARVFKNVPLKIPYKGKLILRGEAVISYADFEKINDQIEAVEDKYKNPRNLCSGSVRQLNNEITAKRNVNFIVYSLIQAENSPENPVEVYNSRKGEFDFVASQGFTVVPYKEVTADNILDAVAWFEEEIKHYEFPSDGLVLTYDDIAYSMSLGRTAKFPRHSIAFKWADEVRETVLKEIEWSPSRTGLINPVAIFDPVELEGTTVSRASVHNISILRSLKLGIGDHITVYKANMIIPQIAENLTGSDSVEIPKTCPACGHPTEVRAANDAESLYCTNPECAAKKIKSFTLFVSRDAMNMDGLSEATLEKFIGHGFIHSYVDLFHLERYKDIIVEMEGFGEKSYQNLMNSIETARTTNLHRVLYGLGIAGIGLANAKLLCRHFDYDLDKIRHATVEEFLEIDGLGEVLANACAAYFSDREKMEGLDALLKELTLEKPQTDANAQILSGMSFVITGSLERFSNRNELKERIEAKGGKVTGSVTGKTTCLINNDMTSSSSKNKKAKELNVRIISEADFLEEYMKGEN